MVEGAGGKRTDRSGHTVRVFQNLGSIDAQNAVAILAKKVVAPFVVCDCARLGMDLTIDLYGEPSSHAVEINDIRANRMKVPKSRPCSVAAQALP